MAPLRHLCLVAVVRAALLPVPPAAAEPLVRTAAVAPEVPDFDDVRGHPTLPTTGSHGTTITWRSSDDTVITTTGEASRPPAGGKPAKVVLTAEVSPTGPFTNRGLILNKEPELGILGTGHSSMPQAPGTEDWYLVHHRFAIPGGDGTHRETTIGRTRFGGDGLVVPVTPTPESAAPQRIRPQHRRALVN